LVKLKEKRSSRPRPHRYAKRCGRESKKFKEFKNIAGQPLKFGSAVNVPAVAGAANSVNVNRKPGTTPGTTNHLSLLT